MKHIKRMGLMITALSMALLIGCAATPKKEGTGEYIDDSVITTKVKVAIFHNPALKSSEINVETFKGIVQLSGFVGEQADIKEAGGIAQSIKGVASVKNDLRVK